MVVDDGSDVILNRSVPVNSESNGVVAETNQPNSVGILQVCRYFISD